MIISREIYRMLMIMLMRKQKDLLCVYICRRPDGFVLIRSVLHIGISCVHNQLSIEVSWLAL